MLKYILLLFILSTPVHAEWPKVDDAFCQAMYEGMLVKYHAESSRKERLLKEVIYMFIWESVNKNVEHWIERVEIAKANMKSSDVILWGHRCDIRVYEIWLDFNKIRFNQSQEQ